jgi:Methyladenine glycosylase
MPAKNTPRAMLDGKSRCSWATTPQMIAYHDTEWGVPQHDDRVLFEFLTLEGAQAGLSWSTILAKRGRSATSILRALLAMMRARPSS